MARLFPKTLPSRYSYCSGTQLWINCIQRVTKVPQSEGSPYKNVYWARQNSEERKGQLYRNIADIQIILGSDDVRLEDLTWRQTVKLDTLKISFHYKPVRSVYLPLLLSKLMLVIQAP